MKKKERKKHLLIIKQDLWFPQIEWPSLPMSDFLSGKFIWRVHEFSRTIVNVNDISGPIV